MSMEQITQSAQSMDDLRAAYEALLLEFQVTGAALQDKIDNFVPDNTVTFYISEAGDDANDGKTAANAIQTIDRAIELSNKRPFVTLKFKGAEYHLAGDVSFDDVSVTFDLTDDNTTFIQGTNGVVSYSLDPRSNSNLTFRNGLVKTALTGGQNLHPLIDTRAAFQGARITFASTDIELGDTGLIGMGSDTACIHSVAIDRSTITNDAGQTIATQPKLLSISASRQAVAFNFGSITNSTGAAMLALTNGLRSDATGPLNYLGSIA